MAACLHNAACGLEGGLAYDTNLISRMKAELEKAVALEHIQAGDGDACQKSLDVIARVMEEASHHPGQTGFIHSDLSFGDIIISGTGLVPIDFSLSGKGCLAQDIGMLLTGITDIQDRRSVVAAYEKARGARLLSQHLDAFYCLSILLFVCCQHERHFKEEWFSRRMRFWVENYFDTLAAGRVFRCKFRELDDRLTGRDNSIFCFINASKIKFRKPFSGTSSACSDHWDDEQLFTLHPHQSQLLIRFSQESVQIQLAGQPAVHDLGEFMISQQPSL